MRIEKRNSLTEKRILTGMIVDTKVLSVLHSKWKHQFRSKWSNLVGQWCIDFFTKYEKAPKSHIEGIFESWSSKTKEKETIEIIEKFLRTLSEEYEHLEKESNSDYLIDLAGKFFNQVQIEKLNEAIQGDLDLSHVDQAISRILNYNKIELGQGSGVDVFKDSNAIQQAFLDKTEPLIRFKGALGRFYGDCLERDGFVAFMAPEKRGKTWCLIDLAFRALEQRKKVAFFAAGDMSQNQMIRRLMIRTAGRPMKSGEYKIPISIQKYSDKKNATIRHKMKKYTKDLSWQESWKKAKEFMKKIRTKENLLKLSCHPNSTLSVRGIKNLLSEWDRSGWTADIVIIDYADILDMSMSGTDSHRDKINETWKQLRSLSQIYHCLVITATQSDAESYKARTMSRSHFSDDKRKIGHVTGMIGINQTEKEKERGVFRFNWVAKREEEYRESFCVYTAGNMAFGNPAMKSCFEKD
jgi:hypothetical protein